MYWYQIFTPEKMANYWQLEPVEATKLKSEYKQMCQEQERECNCGNCYNCHNCRYAKIFTLPEYEVPLM